MTARWALAGTFVTQFDAPIEIIFANPAGVPVLPALVSRSARARPQSWNNMGRLPGSTLPAPQPDGFHGDTQT